MSCLREIPVRVVWLFGVIGQIHGAAGQDQFPEGQKNHTCLRKGLDFNALF